MTKPIPSATGLREGTEVGRYVVETRIARGGMAELYLARARGPFGFNKRCVIKVALPHLAEDPQYVSMFVHEARILANLDHANIAQVLDVGEFDGGPYFAMQYVDGRDVRQIMHALGGQPLDLAIALRIASSVCAGLGFAHLRTDEDGRPLGIVHRDISPSNVMVGYRGEVKLIDFGVAKSTVQDEATSAGVIKGKAAYLSPEQVRAKDIDHRSDIFALGILLFEMTTGRRLVAGNHDVEILQEIVEGSFHTPHEVCDDYPDALARIVMKALKADPEERFQSAEELRFEVEAFARSYGAQASELDIAGLMESLFEVPTSDATASQVTNAAHPIALPTGASLSHGTAATGMGFAEYEDSEPRGQPRTEVQAGPGTPSIEGNGLVAVTPGRQETVVAPSGPYAPVKPSGTVVRRRAGVWGATAAGLAVVTLAGLGAWQILKAPQPSASELGATSNAPNRTMPAALPTLVAPEPESPPEPTPQDPVVSAPPPVEVRPVAQPTPRDPEPAAAIDPAAEHATVQPRRKRKARKKRKRSTPTKPNRRDGIDSIYP